MLKECSVFFVIVCITNIKKLGLGKIKCSIPQIKCSHKNADRWTFLDLSVAFDMVSIPPSWDVLFPGSPC